LSCLSFFHRNGKALDMLLPVCFFLLFLSYFIFGAGWHEPSKLVLHGQAAGDKPVVNVRWNSGQGFNEYEQRLFQLQKGTEDGQITITIGATGRRWPASQSKDVVCAAVLIDGKEVDLGAIASKKMRKDRELRFNGKKEEKITFTVQAQWHVGIRFHTDTSSGVAAVSVNGIEAEQELYMANEAAKFTQLDYWLRRPDGTFTLEIALPRYPIRELEILNGRPSRAVRLLAVELRSKNRATDLLQGQAQALGQVRFGDVLDGMKVYFHPLQFVQQIFFALISAWLLTALLRFVKELGGLRGCFLAGQRYWFWLMLAASLSVFGIWLAAFWPGVMSVDSMKIWRAALLPDVYLNDHPFLNVILYKYLRHSWSNPAVVPLAHVFLTSLLAAWFGFWLFRQGVPQPLMLFWLLFVLGSVPTGIYNVVLWKDIPFALLVVFWACILVKLRQGKRQRRLRWTGQRICALFLLGLALGLIRHNGLVYLAVLPLLVLLLGLVPLKKALPGLAALLLAAGIGVAGLHVTGRTGGASFLAQEIRKYTARLSAKDIAKDTAQVMRDYLTVLNINQKYQQWDKFHHYFQDRQAWWFLRLSGWCDVYPYQKEEAAIFPGLRSLAMRLYEKSYEPPWVWLSWNPVWLLALLPLLTLFFYWLPNTAVLGAVLLAGALPLIYLRIFNWRYYYFLYLGLLFLPAFVMSDLAACEKQAETGQET
jgi:hypothetical protein